MYPSIRQLASVLALATVATATAACGEADAPADNTPATTTPGPTGGSNTPPMPAPSGGQGGRFDCPSLGSLKPPAVPPALEPPYGANLTVRMRAEGTQIYSCKATTGAGGDTTYAWAFKGPEAKLYD